MDNIILVNKDNPIDLDYVPENLVITDQNSGNFHRYINPNLKPMVVNRVKEAFDILKENAYRDESLSIIIDSGYRSSEYQREIMKRTINDYYLEFRKIYDDITSYKMACEKAKKYVALPGYSEHQTGLAIDIACFRNGIYNDQIINSKEAKWMDENASKYGFILRYPNNKEEITGYNYEPWHFRYVGYPKSEEFYDGNWITLEEYHKGIRLTKKR